MTLQVFTARISTRDPDRFDITRKSGGPEGEPFAPSWKILHPALLARQKANRLREVADGMTGIVRVVHHAGVMHSINDIERRAWDAYVPAYLAEMRESYRRDPEAWRKLLARERVVLVCYCTDPARCHRTLLAERILVKLGAEARGETAAAPATGTTAAPSASKIVGGQR